MKKDCVFNCVQKNRKEKNITQENMAKDLNITRQTIIAIEKGNYTPSVLLAIKIAKYFNKPIEDIFSLQDNK